jgi:hypothetical protein
MFFDLEFIISMLSRSKAKLDKMMGFKIGFEIEDEVFSDSECDRLLNALAHPITRSRVGTRNLMANSVITQLASDPRLLRITNNFFGKTLIPFKATLFDKSHESNWLVAWHQDTALPMLEKFDRSGWGTWSEKAGINYVNAPADVLARILALRISLDASTPFNGSLKIFPDTHRGGILSRQEIQQIVHTQVPQACLVKRGGVLAMSPLLLHGSSKTESEEPRRVLHLEYTDALEIADGIKLAIA